MSSISLHSRYNQSALSITLAGSTHASCYVALLRAVDLLCLTFLPSHSTEKILHPSTSDVHDRLIANPKKEAAW